MGMETWPRKDVSDCHHDSLLGRSAESRRLGGVARTRLLHVAGIHRVQTNAGDACRLLQQIARELAAFRVMAGASAFDESMRERNFLSFSEAMA